MLNLRLFGGPPSADHSQITLHDTRAVLVMHVAYLRTSRQIIGLGIADCTLLLIQRFDEYLADLLSITSFLKARGADTVHHPVKCSSFQGDAHHSMLGTKLQCFLCTHSSPGSDNVRKIPRITFLRGRAPLSLQKYPTWMSIPRVL